MTKNKSSMTDKLPKEHRVDRPQPGAVESASSSDKEMEREEASERIVKIKLEQDQIRKQLSRSGRIMEWLKASAGVAAILGLFITSFFSWQQIRQGSVSRDEERFDKAITRLGSQNASERLTGLAGLQLFLTKSQEAKHEATLLFLVNAAAVEKDSTVRSALLNVFESIDQNAIDREALNKTLEAARDRNRSALRTLQQRFQSRALKDNSAYTEAGADEVGVGNASADDLLPLHATAQIITALARHGAYASDLSRIYCVECNFASKETRVNLPNADFNHAYLRQATFRKSNLEGSSFDGADLILTDFIGANLQRARFTNPMLENPPIQAIVTEKVLWAAQGPHFACADLRNADFTNAVLFGFYESDVVNDGYYAQFYGANLAGANFQKFQIFFATEKVGLTIPVIRFRMIR